MLPASRLLGSSKAMQALRREVDRFLSVIAQGRRRPGVLVQGERGVGKTLLAVHLHSYGPRGSGPFVDVNCGSIAESLAEAELFGYEKGAFTDAKTARPGLFEQADGGVLFLDEIGTLGPALQAKLLTVLEQQTVRRVGSTAARTVDVWIIAASNTDLAEAAREGRFRLDLLDRLTDFVFTVPPLRERGDDVIELAQRFLDEACDDFKRTRKSLTSDASTALRAHRWPGNVRELAKCMQRIAVLSDVEDVTAATLDLPAARSEPPTAEVTAAARRGRRDYRTCPYTAADIRAALDACGWSLKAAADRLGVPRNTLRYWLEHKFRLQRPGGVAPHDSSDTAPAVGGDPLRWERRVLAMLRLTLRVPGDPAAFGLPALEKLEEHVVGLEGRVEERGPLTLTLVFGVTPLEDPAIRATQAGLAALKLVERDARTPPLHPEATAAVHVHECLIARGRGADQICYDDKRVTLGRLDDLERSCPAGRIVMSAEAARTVDRRFRVSSIGATGAGVPTFQVDGVQPTPFEVGERRSALVERDRELRMLEERLGRVASGHGQVVALSGAAGVGKSRLLHELRVRLGDDAVMYLEGRCVPYGAASLYLPILDIVRGFFAISDGDAASPAALKIREALGALTLDVETLAPYLLDLLSLAPLPGQLASLSPAVAQTRTVAALRDMLDARSRARPLIVAVEDYHWVDRASAECIATLIDGLASSRVLFIATYRSGAPPAWLRKPQASHVAVPPLSPAGARTIVHAMRAGRILPDDLVEAIVVQAEGIPFILEELTRAAVGDVDLASTGKLPVTVHAAFMARVDRLPAVERRVLEAAAVLGPELSLPALRTMLSDLGGPEFAAALATLRRDDFLSEVTTTPDVAYTFSHVLGQEALYGSLLEAERSAWHERAADAIVAAAPEIAVRTPEVVARHLGFAGRAREASAAWHRAGERALTRGAANEALEHLGAGLRLVQDLPPSPERDAQEINLRLATAHALIAARGYGAPEVEDSLRQAHGLCRAMTRSVEVFPVLFGLWQSRLIRADYVEAQRVADEVWALAAHAGGPMAECQAQFALGTVSFYRGGMTAARDAFEAVRQRYDEHRGAAAPSAQDLGVLSRGYLGITLVLLGFPDRAARLADDAIARARDVAQPFSLALALHFGCLIRKYRREPDIVAHLAGEELALAREYGFPFWLAGGLFWSGWAQAQRGLEDGIARMEHGIEIHERTGARMGVPAYLCDLADSCASMGRRQRAREAAERALVVAEQSREVLNMAEIHRIRGELLVDDAGDGPARGEADLGAALRVAREQSQKLFELRAAVGLARHWRQHGRRADAFALLAPVVDALTEGRDLADARQADALLVTLR